MFRSQSRPGPSTRPRRTLGVFLFACLFVAHAPTSVWAARFHLADGTVLEASYVGEADGQVTVLTAKGKTEVLDKPSILTVDWSHRLSDSREKQALRERTAFFERRRKEAKKLVLAFEKSKPDEHSKYRSQLEGFQEHELLAALDRGLRSSRPFLRDYSFDRLESFQSKGMVVPLVNNALNNPDRDFAKQSQDLALKRFPEVTREVYEYVSYTGDVDRRLLALDTIQQIGSQKSVPRLVQGLSYVHADIRAQVARSKGLREIPVRLSGSSVSIELPELEILEVMTTVQVPVRSLRLIQERTVATLRSITGEDFGDNAEAWSQWWAQEQARQKRAAPKADR